MAQRIAVIGSGIAGLAAARALAPHHEVHVFEAGSVAGGHARTLRAGAYALDTGFIVYNERTYPRFSALIEELGVPTRPTRMSFSVRCDRCRLEFGSAGLRAAFAQKSNLVSPRHWALLTGVVAFFRRATDDLGNGTDLETPLGEYLARRQTPGDVARHCLIPMAAAIWSASPAQVLGLHAGLVLGFLARHGFLGLTGAPRWRTIVGGCTTYVERLVAGLGARLHLATPVRAIQRDATGVTIELEGARPRFERVVLATHTDTALTLLAEPTDDERRILGAIRYGASETVIHTDPSRLPVRGAARACWNYRVRDCRDPRASLEATYSLDRLLGLGGGTHCVTLNPAGAIDASRVLGRHRDQHPILDVEAVRAQRALDRIQGRRRTFFCGAWQYSGFHEDALRSGLEAAARAADPAREAAA